MGENHSDSRVRWRTHLSHAPFLGFKLLHPLLVLRSSGREILLDSGMNSGRQTPSLALKPALFLRELFDSSSNCSRRQSGGGECSGSRLIVSNSIRTFCEQAVELFAGCFAMSCTYALQHSRVDEIFRLQREIIGLHVKRLCNWHKRAGWSRAGGVSR